MKTLSIRVVTDLGPVTTRFTLRNTTPLWRVFDLWYASRGITVRNYKFVCEGNYVDLEDTMDSLDMEDGTIIDAKTEQVGC